MSVVNKPYTRVLGCPLFIYISTRVWVEVSYNEEKYNVLEATYLE